MVPPPGVEPGQRPSHGRARIRRDEELVPHLGIQPSQLASKACVRITEWSVGVPGGNRTRISWLRTKPPEPLARRGQSLDSRARIALAFSNLQSLAFLEHRLFRWSKWRESNSHLHVGNVALCH